MKAKDIFRTLNTKVFLVINLFIIAFVVTWISRDSTAFGYLPRLSSTVIKFTQDGTKYGNNKASNFDRVDADSRASLNKPNITKPITNAKANPPPPLTDKTRLGKMTSPPPPPPPPKPRNFKDIKYKTPYKSQHTTPPVKKVLKKDQTNNSSVISSPQDNKTCHFMKVDAFDPKIIKMVKTYPPISCENGHPSLVYIEKDFIKVNISKLEANHTNERFNYCMYRSFNKSTASDYKIIFGPWSRKFKDKIRLNDEEENISTKCYDHNGTEIAATYISRLLWTKEKYKLKYSKQREAHVRQFAPKETLNVLLVGVDGMSRQNFARSMPKTKDFILRNMNAIQLEKYNKVGLNTLPNIVPMLTGHNVEYLFKLNWTYKKPLDMINHEFIWSEYNKAGYVTALDVEEKYITAFHYLKKGWHISPVDFYTRPLMLALESDAKMVSKDRMCRGDNPGISIHNNVLLGLSSRFNQTSSPYLAFSFLTRLTHDDQNKASSGDDLYLKFLQELKRDNHLHNTILMFFSDHGERFGRIRKTFNGIIESKSPTCYIVLPPWFKSKYPEVFKTFRTNSQRLITAIDLHSTFRDILHFQSPNKPKDLFPGPGISLFQTIPENRTCSDAGIPIQFCNCNSMTQVQPDLKVQESLGTAITDEIMARLGSSEHLCHKLTPKSLQSILHLSTIPQDRGKDVVASGSILYYATVATTPGKGMYEATVEYSASENKAKVVGEVNRVNMYRGEKMCLKDSTIIPFCFCK